MRIHFKLKLPWGTPTHFIEKITKQPGYLPKLHTIRHDPKGRWKAGRKMDMVTGSRFKAVVFHSEICKSVQEITIVWEARSERSLFPIITIDGKQLTVNQANELAKNDGFDDYIQFSRWFNFTNTDTVIIHWTDLKY